ncbi:MAG: dipeptide/tripeptide permease [Proteobacteria bacterium]|nr:MAG: dipeptide/tripeptide permease [Pseudomonadota bacterium]PIE18062.1 MAG: dipeptide/tripeptide permease [Pseudomonadota bacterium]
MADDKHPKALYALFFTEMWERFGFYCMLAIFVLYMVEPIAGSFGGGLGFTKGKASQIYGLYVGLVYFTPIIGGLVADRFLGYLKTIFLGGLFMMAGYFLLAVKSVPTFYSGLGAIIIGNGLFKPNISTMVGNVYLDRPHLKDAGFNIFYMGINIGAVFSPLAASFVKTAFNWNYAFATAGIGMGLSLLILLGTRKLTAVGDTVIADKKTKAAEAKHNDKPATVVREPGEKLRVQALFIIYVVVIVFWMAFHQNGLTLNFWAKNNTLPLAGINFAKQAELTQAINPFFVVFHTLLIIVPFWAWLRRKGKEPSTPAKMMLGMMLTAAAYGLMASAGLLGGDTGKVSAYWLIATYGTITLGELCLSPMGLSVVSKLAPQRSAGTFMGLWFVSTATGNYLSGAVGSLWDKVPPSTFFLILVGSSIFAAFVLRLVLRRLENALDLVSA